MKKILILILALFISSVANADVKSQTLNKVSEKISNLIPGTSSNTNVTRSVNKFNIEFYNFCR